MKRSDWLKEKRQEAEERYDTLWAPSYGEKFGTYNNTTHRQFIQCFLNLLSPQSTILDAACGAGRYLSMLLDKGNVVTGIDQSQGMLYRVMASFPNVGVEKIGLQEISYETVFDGIVCVDAMEHICPEEWLLVLNNFYQALKPQGYLYFTVEISDEVETEKAFERGQELGAPIIYREWADQDVYHYYPPIQQVKRWVQQAGFKLIDNMYGNGYHHFIVHKAAN